MDDRQLVAAARDGDVEALRSALDADPSTLTIRDPPYQSTLLHHAAARGHLAIANLLLDRGFDVNTLESGDETTALHWAAAAGHGDVVRRLLAAGVDPAGHGDDHELEHRFGGSLRSRAEDEQVRGLPSAAALCGVSGAPGARTAPR